MNYFYSLIASKCNKDFINKISGLDTQHKAVMGEKEWHGEWERKSMTCYLGTGQTCHTCLIWHQGLYTNSESFDLSQDTFIVLFAKLSFHSRFWWNTPAVLQWRAVTQSATRSITKVKRNADFILALSPRRKSISNSKWEGKYFICSTWRIPTPEPASHRPQPFI